MDKKVIDDMKTAISKQVTDDISASTLNQMLYEMMNSTGNKPITRTREPIKKTYSEAVKTSGKQHAKKPTKETAEQILKRWKKEGKKIGPDKPEILYTADSVETRAKTDKYLPFGMDHVDAKVDNTLNMSQLLGMVNGILDQAPVKLNTDDTFYILLIPDCLMAKKLPTDQLSLVMLMHLKSYINPHFRLNIEETKSKAVKEIQGCYAVGIQQENQIKFMTADVMKSEINFIYPVEKGSA